MKELYHEQAVMPVNLTSAVSLDVRKVYDLPKIFSGFRAAPLFYDDRKLLVLTQEKRA